MFLRALTSAVLALALSTRAFSYDDPGKASIASVDVQILNHGAASFEKRFEMIERAKHSIDVEYFIYNTDRSGKLFTQALIRKKKEIPSIRIRLLVDSSPTVLALDEDYVAEFEKNGIEVRYYNHISLIRFYKAQYRNHRKLLIVDGKEVLTGGRNIGDDYFDLSPTFNFLDRDIWIRGNVAAEIKRTFDEYWDHRISTRPSAPDSAPSKKKAAELAAFFKETAVDAKWRSAIRALARPVLADPYSQGNCPTFSFSSDLPGYQRAHTRKVLKQIFARMDRMNSHETLVVESPYFIVHNDEPREKLGFLKRRDVRAKLLTNSLASTDAFYVAANFHPKVSLYQNLTQSEMFIYGGTAPHPYPTLKYASGKAVTQDAVWGIHSKTFVFGDEGFAIGTFNVDPRSANLNSELMFFCEGNPKLTQFVLDDIQTRMNESAKLHKDGSLGGGKTIFDNVGLWKKIKFRAAIFPSQWFAWLL